MPRTNLIDEIDLPAPRPTRVQRRLMYMGTGLALIACVLILSMMLEPAWWKSLGRWLGALAA